MRVQEMRLALASVVLLLLAAAPRAGAEMRPYWNAQWGAPESVSAGLGLAIGRLKGDSFRINSRAFLIEARPGLDGGALHLGYLPASGSTQGFHFAGVALKGTLLRTWGQPSSLPPRQTYAGAELHAAWVVKASIGVLWRVSGNLGPASTLTWSLGIGL